MALDTFLQWLAPYQHLLWWVAGVSLIAFILSLALVPWIILRLPHDYFSRPRTSASARHPLIEACLSVTKNLLGLACLLLGFIMLFTPGQGLLTLLAGLLLTDIPGKHKLERWLLQRPGLFSALNWLRRRGGKSPLEPLTDNSTIQQ